MIEIEKPQIECIETPTDITYGKYVVEPLERGYGTTLGNALRRILLSSLPGTAPTTIKIDGVQHEFSTIPGVKEDVTEIVLNIKSLLTKLHGDSGKTVYIEAVGPCTVTAGDIKADGEVEVLNPDLHIATLDSGATLNMEITLSHGRGYVPADRNAVGTVPDFPLYENWLLRNPHYPKKHGLTDLKAVQTQTTAAMEAFDVRTSGCQERSANLSGGNLQKFILARELENTPQVLICSYPTRGLDVKAAWSVRQQIIRAKEQGAGVVLFSGDLEELFAVSDRIVVLYRGAVIGEVQPEHAVPQDVILLMMGGSV